MVQPAHKVPGPPPLNENTATAIQQSWRHGVSSSILCDFAVLKQEREGIEAHEPGMPGTTYTACLSGSKQFLAN